MNTILEDFQKRSAAQLQFALADIEWWNEQVARGVVKPEDAAGYIRIDWGVVAVKRRVLGA
jgi:hypothetical protein